MPLLSVLLEKQSCDERIEAHSIGATETPGDENHTNKFEVSSGSFLSIDGQTDEDVVQDAVDSEGAGTRDDTSEDRVSDDDYVLESEDENNESSICSVSI